MSFRPARTAARDEAIQTLPIIQSIRLFSSPLPLRLLCSLCGKPFSSLRLLIADICSLIAFPSAHTPTHSTPPLHCPKEIERPTLPPAPPPRAPSQSRRTFVPAS